jgi:hypothetical protein
MVTKLDKAVDWVLNAATFVAVVFMVVFMVALMAYGAFGILRFAVFVVWG